MILLLIAARAALPVRFVALEINDGVAQNCSRRGLRLRYRRPPSPRTRRVASARATIETVSADGASLGGKNPGRRGADDPSQSEDALRSGGPGDARRREAGFVCRRRSDAGRGKRTQGDGGAHLSRGDAGDRRGLPPVRPRAWQQHDQRQHHRARGRDERAQAHRHLQGRRAGHCRRSHDADRRLSRRARRPTSNPAPRSSLGGRSRTTARSTPPLSWSARTGSSRRCEKPFGDSPERAGDLPG